MDKEGKTKRTGWLKKLTAGLKKTSSAITDGISNLLIKKKLDESTIIELEEFLITADMGSDVAKALCDKLREKKYNEYITVDELKKILAEDIESILLPVEKPLCFGGDIPYVILVVGVNGAGKTTVIGKMASEWSEVGLKVSVAACDTFRAGARDQLQVWADNANVSCISGAIGADAAGLAYDAMTIAKNRRDEILLIDTAGRLHNKSHLMEELRKIQRVINKQDPLAPHACILVLDACIGQNAHVQISTFKEIVNISGIIITKLDGTASGGIVVSLAQKFGIPIHAIGVGEGKSDLQPFEASAFSKKLMGIDISSEE
jgi:fused signal recognition particle receptor